MSVCGLCQESLAISSDVSILPCAHLFDTACWRDYQEVHRVATEALESSQLFLNSLGYLKFTGEPRNTIIFLKKVNFLGPNCRKYMTHVEKNELELESDYNEQGITYQQQLLFEGAQSIDFILQVSQKDVLGKVSIGVMLNVIKKIRLLKGVVQEIHNTSANSLALKASCPLCRNPSHIEKGFVLTVNKPFDEDKISLRTFFRLIHQDLVLLNFYSLGLETKLPISQSLMKLDLVLDWLLHMSSANRYSEFLEHNTMSGLKAFVIDFVLPALDEVLKQKSVANIKRFTSLLSDLFILHEAAKKRVVDAKECGDIDIHKSRSLLKTLKTSLSILEYYVMKKFMQIDNGCIEIQEFHAFFLCFLCDHLYGSQKRNAFLLKVCLNKARIGFGTELSLSTNKSSFFYLLPEAYRISQDLNGHLLWVNIDAHHHDLSHSFLSTIISMCKIIEQESAAINYLRDLGFIQFVFDQCEDAFLVIQVVKNLPLPANVIQAKSLYARAFAFELQETNSHFKKFLFQSPLLDSIQNFKKQKTSA